MDDLSAAQGNDQSLYQCVSELKATERKYHEQLRYLSDLYILHLNEHGQRYQQETSSKHRTCVISVEEVEKMLLTKIKDMMEISVVLYTELAERLTDWDEESSQIGDLFLGKPDLWDLYDYFSKNLESALGTYDEKMMSSDFAALVSLKQGMDNISLKDLILLPIERLKCYKEFFDTYLERTVNSAHSFGHPDFSDFMQCKKKVENMIPTNYDEIVNKKKVDDYKKIESLLGDQMAPEFTAFIKHIHEEPASSKSWKKRSYKKTPSKLMKSESSDKNSNYDQVEIGGRKFKEESIAPDILNALRKDEETQVMVGMVSPSRPTSESNSACDNYVTMEDKVKVRGDNEVQFHTYTLLLFNQCLIFSKVRPRSMKISRIIKLRNMWVSEYKEEIGFGQVEKQENTCIGGWLGTEGWEDDELLQFHRVIFQFPNSHVRRHWFTLIQRYIKHSRDKIPVTSGTIKVYFKGSDSRLSLPIDSIWMGMSCQDLQINITQTVEEVIKNAVSTCQMIDNVSAYTLTFIILQDTKIMFEEQLFLMEMPLIIQNDTKTMFSDQTMEPIFILRHNIISNVSVPPSRQRASTLTQFFRRGGRGAAPTPYSRLSTMSDMQVATEASSNKMFGLTISKFFSINTGSQEIPTPLLDVLIYIYTDCFVSEGIFRKPGSRAVQRQIEAKLDNGETIDWVAEQMQAKCYLPNVASSLLKNYFRSIPDGLFPKVLFPEFEKWRTDGSDAGGIMSILAKIPDQNMTVIRYTFHVLKRIVDNNAVNLMTADNLSTCIGPSLVTWPEDANALSIHADQNRTQTPSVVVAFLLERVFELFGPIPTVLSKSAVKDEEVSSRRSRLSNEANQDADSSEDEGEKSNLWLRTLLRSSINEHSTSSSMFVEIGSPPLLSLGKRTPSPVLAPSPVSAPSPVLAPVVVPQTVLMEQPRILTIHSQALQSPLSVSPEQCDLPDTDHTPTESKTFFRFSSKKGRSSKSSSDVSGGGGCPEVVRKKGTGLRRSRKTKKEDKELKCSSVSDISSEEEYKKDNVFTRNTRSIREKSGGESSRKQRPTRSVEEEPTPTEIKKTGSFSSGSRVEGRVKSFIEQERSEVLLARGSPGAGYREHRTLSADDKDDIQKIKEHPVAKRVLVKHKSTKAAVCVQHSYPEQSTSSSQSYSSLQHCTSLHETPSPGPAKEGHDLAHLVESLEKLTNPRLAPYRKFGGSIGTESGTSSNDDESVVEQESYV
ncbi:rho GTPase-activating protein 20-like isoform X2 [Bolinopsis microptera]|uniref:rho GTPase-activating protein 20-like isoform X2 n=1 Tax=Bolinopsis microptera TaxID=2820187 RepID=UPI00307A59F6